MPRSVESRFVLGRGFDVKRMAMIFLCGWWGGIPVLAQSTSYVGTLLGVSTLSADGTSSITPTSTATSLYRPENGLALNVLGGVHLTDYLSVQGNYIWNRNAVTLTSQFSSTTDFFFYEQSRRSTQHSGIADLLLYFRNRRSGVRPYLSTGTGIVRLRSQAHGAVTRGAPRLPPPTFTSVHPALRVAVGIDLTVGRGWRFRYSFSETIGKNPVSAQLSPVGRRNLANFQNLFGAVRTF
jgi:hypothetical protein